MLYYTTCININLKNCNQSKQKTKSGIKYNNSYNNNRS